MLSWVADSAVQEIRHRSNCVAVVTGLSIRGVGATIVGVVVVRCDQAEVGLVRVAIIERPMLDTNNHILAVYILLMNYALPPGYRTGAAFSFECYGCGNGSNALPEKGESAWAPE